MGAFRGAVDVGAHAIETDLHLSKDGVVVLSHDATLKRCFGTDMKISECSWDFLSTLRTLRDKNEGMPRLRDLLDMMNRPGMEHLWILLDVKVSKRTVSLSRKRETDARDTSLRRSRSTTTQMTCSAQSRGPCAK